MSRSEFVDSLYLSMGPSAGHRENEQLAYSQEGSKASTELAQNLQIDLSEIGPNNLTAKEQEAEGNVCMFNTVL